MRIVKWVVIVFVVLFVIAQFVRPTMSNPVADPARSIGSHTQMTPEVASLVERSCADCHTTNTHWPWYSKIAPVSWYLANDVNEGRRHLSMSDWAAYDPKRAANKLDEMCEQVQQGEMPPSSYLLIHTDSKLSDSDKKVLCDWTAAERAREGQAQKAQ